MKQIFLVLSHPINCHHWDNIYHIVFTCTLMHNLMLEFKLLNYESNDVIYYTETTLEDVDIYDGVGGVITDVLGEVDKDIDGVDMMEREKGDIRGKDESIAHALSEYLMIMKGSFR